MMTLPALPSVGSESRRRPSRPEVVVKVQRRKYATNAVDELELRRRIGSDEPDSRLITECVETFTHDGHICQVYESHGRDTDFFLKRGPLPLADVKTLTRQVLRAVKLIHARGLIHADIKPGNVLWCERRREARVIDLGNAAARLKTGSAIGTREYCPPEMLVGNELTPAVDLWALGCSVFEWLTGDCLFKPWEVCSQKYTEFDDEDDDAESAGPDEDDLEEEREQLPAGMVLAGKYRLQEEIGRGKCATVWTAEALHEEPLREPLPAREEARAIAAPFRKPKEAPKGYNIYEVVLGYEHFLLMQQLLGKFPDSLARSGRFHDLFYDANGSLRFEPEIQPVSLSQVLAEKHGFARELALDTEAFLLGLLQFEPALRMTAEEALTSPWLAELQRPG